MVVKLKKAGNCKICNSPNRIHYELLYFRSLGNLSYRQMEEESSRLKEDISYRTFARHFGNSEHYDPERIEQLIHESKVNQKILLESEEKAETINVLKSFENNLKDLKDLIDKTKGLPALSPHAIIAIGNLIRHHTDLLERIKKERESLSLRTTLSEAEMIKLMSEVASLLCSGCKKELWSYLNAKLERGP